ncbi:MAG: hypothetical protein ACYC8T_37340 [Myxococcaceae bacterium]
MKLTMSAVTIACVFATIAGAQEVQPGSGEADLNLVGNGFHLGLGLPVGSTAVLVPMYGGSVNSVYGFSLDTPLSIGYRFGQNSLSLGLAGGASAPTTNFGPGFLAVAAGAKYRRYLAPLRAGGLAPFFQGEFAHLFLSSTAGGNYYSSSMPTILAVSGKGGAEFLFSRHFALGCAVGLRYTNIQVNSQGTGTVMFIGDLMASVHL